MRFSFSYHNFAPALVEAAARIDKMDEEFYAKHPDALKRDIRKWRRRQYMRDYRARKKALTGESGCYINRVLVQGGSLAMSTHRVDGIRPTGWNEGVTSRPSGPTLSYDHLPLKVSEADV